jgi:hypothetical protein
MTRSDGEVYTETGKKELPKRLSQGNHPDKKTNIAVKVCKHVTPVGWCSKKHQRCPLLNHSFINL